MSKMFHDTNLHLTGDGSYVISSIDHSQEEESSLRSLVRDGKSLRPRLQGSKAEQFVALRSERYKVGGKAKNGSFSLIFFFKGRGGCECVVKARDTEPNTRSLANRSS
jgi:hypothetical protein